MARLQQHKNLIYLTHTRGLFIGHVPLSMRSSQGSPVLIVNLNGQFSVNMDGIEFRSSTILLKAGMVVEGLSEHSLIANFILDRLAGDYERIQQQMRSECSGVYFDLKNESAVSEILKGIYASECNLQEALRRLTGYFEQTTPAVDVIERDPRIIKVVKYIRERPFENSSLEAMAKLANLSIPRLVDLFKQEMDVPIRKFRTWKRFFAACQAIAAGKTITEAAHDAGFTDSSHFNKSFRDMFGANPKDIFHADTRIIVNPN